MKLTKEQLADALDIYPVSAKEMLCGVIRMKRAEVREIAEYFGIATDEVFKDNPGIVLLPRREKL